MDGTKGVDVPLDMEVHAVMPVPTLVTDKPPVSNQAQIYRRGRDPKRTHRRCTRCTHTHTSEGFRHKGTESCTQTEAGVQ